MLLTQIVQLSVVGTLLHYYPVSSPHKDHPVSNRVTYITKWEMYNEKSKQSNRTTYITKWVMYNEKSKQSLN